MGNTSSQPVAGTQVPVSQLSPEVQSSVTGTPAGSEVVVSPPKQYKAEQRHKPTKKRPRSSIDHGDNAVPLKKRKEAQKITRKHGTASPVDTSKRRTRTRQGRDGDGNVVNSAADQAVSERGTNGKKTKRRTKLARRTDASPQEGVEDSQTGKTPIAESITRRGDAAPGNGSNKDNLIQVQAQATSPARPGSLQLDGTTDIPATQARKRKTKVSKAVKREGRLEAELPLTEQAKHQNGRAINPVGKPGPKRKKVTPALTQNKPVENFAPVEGQDEEPAVLHKTVGSPQADVQAADSLWKPTPPKRKKRKVTEPLSSQEIPETQVQPKLTLENPSQRKARPQSDTEPVQPSKVRKPVAVIADKAPTEPESPGVREDFSRVDATDQVREWLDKQQSPISAPIQSSTRKRKRVSQYQPDDDEDYQNPANEAEDAPATVKKRPSATKEPNIERSEKVHLPEPITNGPTSGAFIEQEKAAADAVFDYVVQNDPNIEDAYHLKALTIDWTNVGQFKVEMQNALPCRTKVAVRKFCQRRFHAFEKGQWTGEQDALLRKAYTEHPDKWATISEFVDRTAQDCRDRYRNVVQYGDDLVSGAWSQEEEKRLAAAVEECIEAVKKNGKVAALIIDRERLEDMIDWKTVAAKMGGSRSRKRCLEKWQKLKRRSNVSAADSTVAPLDQPAPVAIKPFDGESKRVRKVETKFRTFKAGDCYDVLREIHTAIDDHSKVFHDESTLWSVVAMKNPGSKFNSALRRRAYHEVLDVWEFKDKKKVKKAQTVAAKAKAMASAIEKWMEKHGEGLDRAYKPEIVVDPKSQKKEKKTQVVAKPADGAADSPGARLRAFTAARKKQHLSEEYVLNSDEEDDMVQQSWVTNGLTGISGNEEQPAEAVADDHSSGPAQEGSENAEVPETQLPAIQDGQRHTPVAPDDVEISSINSRYELSLGSPNMAPRDFMAKCKAAGRQQHEEFTTQRKKKQRRAQA